ncbi:glycoside hydrolase family 3 C-terminal domain-containing protein [Acholeplasma manati]|uniref:Glycoside hydrolase family 3 C-terminal domain-containing protein n=1 Tax=Paracholeplasma manati TaxID=591373 RepID=A0ABT2Y827_9MOLU|nr:glycoside hydrolase family 3 C-terminal domain-containing protein [Paracholeplasma manati]MCV2232870.1 glycoside hydrolase family 3 C-terminal domain-containing protein [Paracholeplasma manati]
MENLQKNLEKLTTQEKLNLMSGDGLWHIKHYDKLGLKRFMMTDGPHGLRKQASNDAMGIAASHPATCFPTASLLACSFDPNLMYEMGQALAKEAIHQDVSMILGPGINMKRSPLCGRNFEYFSEDPYLAGTLSKSYIEGVQSLNVGTCLKHYFANNQEKHRMTVDAIIDKRAMYETYLKAFGIAIEGKPWAIMTSYNKVNGTYVAESKWYMSAIARNRYGFKGAFITDWGAMNDRVASLKAGLSLEMPGSKNNILSKAYKKGLITDQEVDFAVKPLLWMLEKGSQKKEKQPINHHHELARKIAAESMVLLKNEGILPLNTNQRVALIGRFAKEPRIQGSGSSKVNPQCVDSLLDVFTASGISFEYADGYTLEPKENPNHIQEALKVCENKDVIVLSIGLTELFESEGYDRTHLNIPLQQLKLIEAITEKHDNVVVVLQGGSVTLIPYKDKVQAILNAYLPGEAGALAIHDILYGKVNPSGKLAETYPIHLDDTSSYPFFPGGTKSVYYAESIYIGYRYFDKKGLMVTYPFGFGLSYSTFKIENVRFSNKHVKVNHTLKVTMDVSNTSTVDGKEIVQIYISDLGTEIHKPSQELKAYQKVFVKAQSKVEVTLELKYSDFEYYDTDIDEFRVKQGHYEIKIGDSSRTFYHIEKIQVEGDHIDSTEPTVYHTFDRYISVHDFEALYGVLPPKEDTEKHKYHLNSTIGEIKDTRIGGFIYKIGIKEIQKTPADAATKRMMKEQFEELPLRAIPLFSGDKFTHRRVLGLIDIMNKHPFRGVVKLL